MISKIKIFLHKIKTLLKIFIKPLLSRVKSGTLRRRSRYARYYKRLRINKNIVIYESFFGRGMLCNPYAIFLYLLTEKKYSNLTHVWVLDDLDNHKELIARYSRYKNVKFIKYQSRQYLKYLCRAKYLVNNGTFPSYFTKKEGQIYINTWHGVPLKKMGFDMPNGSIESSNTIRNFLHTDYLLSTSPILTKMYLDAYKLKGIYQGEIIESGYPRLDLLKNTKTDEIFTVLRKSGVVIQKNKKLILYAPTWRGASFGNVIKDIENYIQFKAYFDSHVDTKEYQLLIKVHQSVYEKIKSDIDSIDYMIPANIDANELMSITDILISDFSSIFFDFLATNKPIIFYIPDAEDYQSVRGTNYSLDSLPGSVVSDLPELCDIIKQKNYRTCEYEKYQQLKSLCCNYDIGNISAQVVDYIWGHKDGAIKKISCLNDKKKIFITRARMRVNGMSTSLLNLLNAIDYDQYDVSVQVAKPVDNMERRLIEQINKNVRVFVRNSTMNVTYWQDCCQYISSNYGCKGIYKPFYNESIFAREFKRSYGDAHFDYVLDFDGYNTYFSLIHLHKGSKNGIWLHNDMEAEREIKFPWLKRQFEIYPRYDFLISCSKEVMKVNREKLATPDTFNKFVYTKNQIDIKRIQRLLALSETVEINGNVYCAAMEILDDGLVKAKLIPLNPKRINPVYINQEQYNFLHISNYNEATVKDALLTKDKSGSNKLIRFITVGRFSPEKNHKNLIDAFANFIKDGNNVMLYIVGDGLLKKKMAKQIEKLNMGSRIILTGNIENPFALMKMCDCFILPSLHEGQPMVINEARIVGLPIIVSEFSSVKGSIIPNGQYMIGTSVDEIVRGLNAFVNGQVPDCYDFDAEKYNKEAYEEFLCAINEHDYPVNNEEYA